MQVSARNHIHVRVFGNVCYIWEKGVFIPRARLEQHSTCKIRVDDTVRVRQVTFGPHDSGLLSRARNYLEVQGSYNQPLTVVINHL